MEYSPFIMALMWKTLERVEIPPAEVPVVFPPPIFAYAASVLVFLSFGGSLSRKPCGSYV
jgi:hypothetical protein